MKRILFAIPHLGCGGAEKELVTLLSLLDPARWQVDLFLFEEAGMFRDFVPGHIRILPRDPLVTMWNQPLRTSVFSLLKQGCWGLALKRIRFRLQLRRATTPAAASRLAWNYYRQLLPRLPEHYDAAIGYMEGMSNYFIDEMVSADRKLASMHSDYSKMPHLDRDLDAGCFGRMDAIITDSEGSREVLAQSFPQFAGKIHAIECFISPALIREMASRQTDPFADGFQGLRLLTIGRLSHPKGIDIAARACRRLKDLGLPIRWYVLGDGEERPAITALIESLSLQQDFVLLGNRANPYPWLGACDIYVQPSRWEGWGIAIDEAKILAKPIVLTRFPIAESRVEHMATGLVADLQEEALAQGIATLAGDPQLRGRFCRNLQALTLGSENELRKFLQLLGETPQETAR